MEKRKMKSSPLFQILPLTMWTVFEQLDFIDKLIADYYLIV